MVGSVVVLLAVVLLGRPFFGCRGPVDATRCVTQDTAAVCIDKRGPELEVRATGLLAGSSVEFNYDPIPVTSTGAIDGRWFYITNEYWPTNLRVEAVTAEGMTLAGTVEFEDLLP